MENREVGKIFWVFICLVLCIFLIQGCVDYSENTLTLPAGWMSEIVDTRKNAGEYSSIALDKNNDPHIVYHTAGGEGLKYAFKNKGKWSIQIIERGKYVGGSPKIVLDSTGNPHICYNYYNEKNETRGLKYAYWNGIEWQLVLIDERGWEGSIAVDSRDRPHIAYSAAFGNGLGYAYWDGQKWQKQVVDVLGDWKQYKTLTSKDRYFGRIDISMVLDVHDNPHVAYFQRESGDLRYISLVGDKWNIQVIDSGGLVGLESSIAIDDIGRVHIAYLQADDYDLKYAYWDGEKWTIQTIDAKDNTGCKSNIVLDSLRRPHVLYSRCNDEEIRYAYWNGLIWSIQTIQTQKIGWTTPISDTISMALDVESKPHISCFDNHKKALKYIWKL